MDEYSLVLDELKLKKENLPAICYMGVGEDLNVLPLSDSNVGYIESVLRTLLEGDSADSGDSGESDESVGDESKTHSTNENKENEGKQQ